MTNEEIQKLLGGYATNTLTEAERKVLFEAALDDQDLFNAMQAEEALKDLLSDPISRQQVRQALETPAAAKPAAAWWAWGGAASALMAAVVIVAVIRWNPAHPRPQEVASVTATRPADQPAPLTQEAAAASKPEPARPKALRPASPAVAQGPRKDEADLARALPPTSPPAPPAQAEERERPPSRSNASSEAPRSQDAGHSQNSQVGQNASNARDSISNQTPARQEPFQAPPASNALRDSDRRMATMSRVASGLAGGFTTGPLRFSLMKRDSNGDFAAVPANPDLQKGDAVQIRVVPVLSGYISLSQLDRSGTWRRVFPAAGLGIPVVANTAYNLPAAPIEVTDKDEKFRVTLSLGTPETKADVSTEAAGARGLSSLKKAKVAPPPPKSAPQPSPFFVDLTIGPKSP